MAIHHPTRMAQPLHSRAQMGRVSMIWIVSLAAMAGCGSTPPNSAYGAKPGANDAGPTDTMTTADGGAMVLLDGSVQGTPPSSEGGPDVGGVIGQVNGTLGAGVPVLPTLTNVVAWAYDDAVGIDFDPVDKAIDYRVYPMPNASDLTANADGSIAIKNAIYRCAGRRETYDLQNDLNANASGLYVENPPYNWKAKVGSNPMMGYVFVTPGPNRLPVYAIGGYPSANELGWRESRFKIYTTDEGQRQSLLGKGWRDDGIAFYVPSASSAATKTIHSSQAADTWSGQTWAHRKQYYFTDADVSMHAGDTTPPAPAFQVLAAAAPDTQPLFAVFYPVDDQAHTELAVGNERFQRAAHQGEGPLWHLEWAGITQPTTLVVEALATGCPFQGFLSPQHRAAQPGSPGELIPGGYPTWNTLTDLQTASSTGEVFVNGQYDGTSSSPVPIARSFVQVAPRPPAPSYWDWYQGFHAGTDLGMATEITGCVENGKPGYNCGHWQTPDFDISIYRIAEAPTGSFVFAYGQFLGQMWEVFDDAAMDVTGKVRFTARKMGTVSPDQSKYFHATMSVNIVSTDRRYPQFIISDRPAPVQEGMNDPANNTLLIQPRMGPSMQIEIQAIHGLVRGTAWDVNDQAPYHVVIPSSFQDGTGGSNPSSPAEPAFEHAGVDRMTRFDAYVSSQRVYLFMDGQPAGCMAYPSGFSLNGSVSVTAGDVLYHEAAPDGVCGGPKPFSYLHAHQCVETERHFDHIGFKSDVPAPAWNEAILPCTATTSTAGQ